MPTESFRFSKQLVLLFSTLLGILLSMDGLGIVFRHEGNHPLWMSISFILIQAVFFTAMAWSLWYVNLFTSIKSWKWNLLLSILTAALFITISYLIIPYSDYINEFIDKNVFYHKHHDDWQDWTVKSLIVFFICYISSVVYILVRKNIKVESNYEKLEKEALQSKLSALTNQINPHFFFNALNSLYSLVFNDNKEKSLEYITKMSGVFRYILQSEEKMLVPLKDEMNFLDTYLFMLIVKYDQKLEINQPKEVNYSAYMLPRLSLLPLIENVIKHNEISTQYPMTITIDIDTDGWLVISNPKREKLDVASTGVGIKNLNNRFELIVGKPIEIKNTKTEYIVRLPLIKA